MFPNQQCGGRWTYHRLMFDGILWVLRAGAPWRDLPERYGQYRYNGLGMRIMWQDETDGTLEASGWPRPRIPMP